MKPFKIIKDDQKSIEVMHHVGYWMRGSGLHPSDWWKPENMNLEYLKKFVDPDEFYTAIMDGKPAASMVLQETERNQSWKSVDGENPKQALYLHWLCVHRDFAGQGVTKIMVEYAKKEAKKRGFSLLRLDTDASEIKLCSLYEKLGFKLAGKYQEEDRLTAFYQMKI